MSRRRRRRQAKACATTALAGAPHSKGGRLKPALQPQTVSSLERQNLKTIYETAHFDFHPARNHRSVIGADQSWHLSGEPQQTARGACPFGKDGRFLSRPIGSNVENS